jgi:glycosyltransferase involved in cell wall biosynthesis
LKNAVLIVRLLEEIRRFRPDVVHILSEGQVWLALLPALAPGVPVVVTLHDVATHPGDLESARVPRALIDAFVRRASAVLVHGEGLRAAAVARLRLAPEAVFSVAHPLLWKYRRLADEAGFGPKRRSDGAPVRLLFFGRIAAYKGLEDLLEADESLGDEAPPRRITIAGRGASPAAAAAAARRPDRFDLRLRAVPDAEVAALFAAADLLVLPYREASQSGVLAIAPTFALPVAACETGELGAMVREAGMGLLTPPGDPLALAGALRRLLEDPDLRRALAARSAAAAGPGGAFAPERVVQPTLDAYAFAQKSSRAGAKARRGVPGRSASGMDLDRPGDTRLDLCQQGSAP